MSTDPFGTTGIRARVLDAWAASPARFREDANAEEDLARGAYRDRLVVELAQNAADAARRSGVPGRLRLQLVDDVLLAANTGAPLTAEGVESLSTLRASAKRDETDATGRFGVGFAAVLAVTDEPRVLSSTGGVRWSVDEARAAVHAVPALADELARRRGHVPALRLPFPCDEAPAEGFDTTVVLPLRDAAAATLVRRLLADVDDALLLSLPALDEVVVEVDGKRRVVADAARWHVVRRAGTLDPQLLADRPTEERDRPAWSVAGALPLAGQPVPATVHAPTPTDEPLDLPALLIASFPLDPTRRHVAPGPLTDFLVGESAEAYAELAADGAVVDDPMRLVPGPVAAGRLDAALRAAVVDALTDASVLVDTGGTRVRPRDAVSVIGADQALRGVLGEVLPGLVPDHPALARLGARRLPLADVVDLLAEVRRDPSWWHGLYDALGPAASGSDREALGGLPVPLADSRLVRGPRGLLMPGERLPEGIDAVGLRVVHPQAAHPVLLRLGAMEASARTVLEEPAVRAAVETAEDAPDPDALAETVLGLVTAAHVQPGELPWLGDLLLRDDGEELAAARDLALPASLLAEVVEPDALGVPDARLVQRWGADVLTAAGVLADLGMVLDHDVVLDESCDHDLADEPDWVTDVVRGTSSADLPPVLPEMRAVRDLDLIATGQWPRVLSVLAGHPDLRAAVTEPARVVTGGGRPAEAPSYTAWWLRRNARLDGHPPPACATPGAVGELAGLYDVTRSPLDDGFLTAIGVRTSLAALLREPGGADDLLARLADPSRPVVADQLARVYAGLAGVEPAAVTPPDRVRVRPDTVVDADRARVLDGPHHLQLPWSTPPLLIPLSQAAALADVLDVDTTGADLRAAEAAGGARRPVPVAVGQVLPGAVDVWWEHDELSVTGHDVDWWVNVDGSVHACTIDGLARGLAWSAGRWDNRLLVAAVLAEPDRIGELLTESRLEL